MLQLFCCLIQKENSQGSHFCDQSTKVCVMLQRLVWFKGSRIQSLISSQAALVNGCASSNQTTKAGTASRLPRPEDERCLFWCSPSPELRANWWLCRVCILPACKRARDTAAVTDDVAWMLEAGVQSHEAAFECPVISGASSAVLVKS